MGGLPNNLHFPWNLRALEPIYNRCNTSKRYVKCQTSWLTTQCSTMLGCEFDHNDKWPYLRNTDCILYNLCFQTQLICLQSRRMVWNITSNRSSIHNAYHSSCFPNSSTRGTVRQYNSESKDDESASQKMHSYENDLIKSTETYHILRNLKLNKPDDFQASIMWWMKGYVKSSGDHIIKYNEDDPIDGAVGSALGRVALVVGGSKTGKTTSYMLALSDIVNQERHDLEKFGPIRDEYRNKLILKKSISTTHYHSRTDMPKIHGIPKFDWNALIVPLGVVLVPHREIAQELFELSCKMQLRTRLLAGGMGNKKAASFRGGYATVTNDKQYDNIDLIISTPEMLVRVLNGAYNDTRIDIKYLQFLIMEEADLLCDGFYLEQMNEVLNMIHSYKLRTLCITTAKTDALMNYLQHSHLDGKGDMLSQIQITHPKSHSVGQNVKQIFTAIAQGDPVDRLIETFDELDVRVGSGGPKTLVFCNTVKCCKFLEHTLSDRGYKVVSLHGEMGYGQRTNAIKDYGTRNNILVATNFASRGILNKEVDNVVSFDFPDNVAEYLHRASRVSTNGTVNTLFSKKHIPMLKNIQRINTVDHQIEYRNVSARVARVLQLQLEWDAKIALRNRKLKKGGRKALKLPPRRNILSPANKKAMKRFYLREKAIKKVQLLQKRGVLRKGYGLPKWPDRAIEASDSQEFVRMQRSADGFLQIIPKRRSRTKTIVQEGGYDHDAIPIKNAPTYQEETKLKPRKHHRNTHFS